MRLARTRFLKDRPLSRLIQHSTNGINLFMCPISERHVRNITHLTTFDKLDYAAKNPKETMAWSEAGQEREYWALAAIDVAHMLADGVCDGTGLSAEEAPAWILLSWRQVQGYLEDVAASESQERGQEGTTSDGTQHHG